MYKWLLEIISPLALDLILKRNPDMIFELLRAGPFDVLFISRYHYQLHTQEKIRNDLRGSNESLATWYLLFGFQWKNENARNLSDVRKACI